MRMTMTSIAVTALALGLVGTASGVAHADARPESFQASAQRSGQLMNAPAHVTTSDPAEICADPEINNPGDECCNGEGEAVIATPGAPGLICVAKKDAEGSRKESD